MKLKFKSITNLIAKFTPLALFAAMGLALAAPQVAQGDDTAVGQYVRFTVTQKNGTGTGVALSEIALYGSDGSRLNANLSFPGKNQWTSFYQTANSCCNANGSIGGGGTLDQLFDTNISTDFIVDLGVTTPNVTYVLYMHLASSEQICFYNIASASGISGATYRAPVAWELAVSPAKADWTKDNADWTVVSTKTASNDDGALTKNSTWYRGGGTGSAPATFFGCVYPKSGVTASNLSAGYYIGDDYVMIFDDPSQTATLNLSQSATARILCVGGGGSGGFNNQNGNAGGGGAGGFIDTKDTNPAGLPVPPGTYTITVGAGGDATSTSSGDQSGKSGGPSSILRETTEILKAEGGSGGKCGYGGAAAGGGSGIPTAHTGGSGGGNCGGGGAGSYENGNAPAGTAGGAGGAGSTSDITGSPVEYAGGGGGARGGAGQTTQYSGGLGASGGGNGGASYAVNNVQKFIAPTAGRAGSGSGGGGSAGGSAVAGGSGIVVIRLTAGSQKTSIANATVTYSNPSTPFVYNASAQNPTVTVTLGGTDITEYCTVSWGSQTIIKDVGSYTPTITANDGTDYTGSVSSPDPFVINQATINVSSVAFNPQSFTYDGNSHSLEVASLPSTVSVTYSGNGRTDVGEQTVTATLAAKDTKNYKLTGETIKTAKLTITQAQNTFTAGPSISGWVEGQTPSNPSATPKFGSAANVSFQYSSNETSGYTSTKPSTAGTWYMKATSPGTANYASVTSAAVRFVIEEPGARALLAANGYSGAQKAYVVGEFRPGDNEYVIVFTNSVGSFTIERAGKAQILVVGGGGAGGSGGGSGTKMRGAGGGAGGVVYNASYDLQVGTYTVNVGAGGSAQAQTPGGNGGDSMLIFGGETLIHAYGGGGGGCYYSGTGRDGGSGGGGCGEQNYKRYGGNQLPAALEAGNRGNKGGAGDKGSWDGVYGGGGGGGAAEAGKDDSTTDTAGYGGAGFECSILGSSVYFGGGGGGSGYKNHYAKGGVGGGGDGSKENAKSGVDGYGGGGGGAGGLGGNGGCGTVIVRLSASVNDTYVSQAEGFSRFESVPNRETGENDNVFVWTDATEPHTFTIQQRALVQMLVVGGGGAGGNLTKQVGTTGGGAGGEVKDVLEWLDPGTYTVLVGKGGQAKGTDVTTEAYCPGSPSSLTLTGSSDPICVARGGSAGGDYTKDGQAKADGYGGGGGGTYNGTSRSGGQRTDGAGFNGGSGYCVGSGSQDNADHRSGGGAGAGDAGMSASATSYGYGGDGVYSDILGLPMSDASAWYGGGGGGGAGKGANLTTKTAVAGGKGGGGTSCITGNDPSGLDGYGGGGGGDGYTGPNAGTGKGSGGCGTVIVRIQNPNYLHAAIASGVPGKASCDVTWTVVGVGSDPANTVSVKVRYGLTEACADGEIDCGSEHGQGDTGLASLTGLTQGSLYYAKVTIADANSSSTAMTTFKTLGSQVFAKPDGTGSGSSWEDAASLKAAIATACNYVSEHPEDAGYAVFLKAGVYEMSEDVSNRLISQPITLRGGFKGEAGTSQDLAANPVSTIDGMTQYQLFKVTATSGTNTMERLNITRGLLRAIEKTGAGELVLRDCSFDQNGFRYATAKDDVTYEPGWSSGGATTRYGGAICATAGSLVVERCTFTGNRYHVEGSLNNSSFYYETDAMIKNCTAPGGAIYAEGLSSVQIRDTRFIKNGPMNGKEYHAHREKTKGSVICLKSSPATIERCEFRGNSANNQEVSGDSLGNGGTVYISGDASATTFDHCIFVANSGNYSDNRTSKSPGGLIVDTSSGSVGIESCTFAYNGTYRGRGGNALMVNAGTVTVQNSIFHGNLTYTDDASYPKDIKVNGGSLTVSYSMFDGIDTQHIGGTWTQGVGLEVGDPLLATPSVRMQLIFETEKLDGGYFSTVAWSVDPAEIDVHLRSSSGRYDGNAWVVDLREDSPAIDKGTGEYVNETAPNGGVRNLGAYGNTAEASRSKLDIPYPPHLSDVATGWADQYTDPTFTFSLLNEEGKPDVYGANITIYWSETAPANPADPSSYGSSRDFGSKMSGEPITLALGQYFQADKTVYYLVYAVNEDGTDGKSGTFSTAGRPVPAGGGASVIHVDPASGNDARDGSFWNQTVQTLARAAEIANANHDRYQVWIKGNATVTSANMGAFTTPVQIYGGFEGTEISVDERSASARTTLTGSSSGLLTLDASKDTSNGGFVLDGIVFTGSTGSAVTKTGYSSLAIRNCEFTGNGGWISGGFNGGALNMDGGSSLKVVNTEFSGNHGYDNVTAPPPPVHGSALYLVNVGQADIQGCVFSENGPSIAVNNELFYTRMGSRGSAIYAGNTQLLVSGTKFLGNRIESSGNTSADGTIDATTRCGGGTVYLVGNCGGSSFRNCAFVGNSSCGETNPHLPGGVLIYQKSGETCDFDNCTFAWNASLGSNGNSIYSGSGVVNVRNSIFYGSTCVNDGVVMTASEVTCDTGSVKLDYCLFESTSGAYSTGTGGSASNIVTGNPLFATETVTITKGYGGRSGWNAPTFSPGATSIDVHLRSKVGRLNGSVWVTDSADSPALDQGDPTADYSNEPDPNGGRLNLGAYGNTAEASKSQSAVVVTLNGNDGSAPNPATVTATPGAAMPTLEAGQIPIRTGYTFTGYFTSVTDGTKYYNADGSSAKTCDLSEGTTLFAQWTANEYNVEYNLNGGTTQQDLPETLNYGQRLRMSVPTKGGSVFIGWTVSGFGSTAHWYKLLPDGSGYDPDTRMPITSETQLCIDGEKDILFFNLCDNVGGTATLTAHWNEIIAVPTAVPGLAYKGIEQTGVSESATYTISGNKETNAGSYTATVTPNTGYCWSDGSTTSKTVPWSIGKVTLTAKMDDKQITYGDAKPTYTYKLSGFVNGENESKISGWAGVGTSPTYSQGSDCGEYTIKGVSGTMVADNYEIPYNFTDGKLTVSPRVVTLSWPNLSFVYDGTEKVPTCTIGNLYGSDAVTATVAVDGGPAIQPGTYTAQVTELTGDKAANYSLPTEVTKSFTITAQKVTLNDNEGDEGDGFVNLINGKLEKTNVTRPFRNGWSFRGYYTEQSYTADTDAGTQIYDKNGDRVGDPTLTDDQTLYAHWTFITTYYLAGTDQGYQPSFDGTPLGKENSKNGWAETSVGNSVRHTVESGHDYVATQLLNMDRSKEAGQSFKGDTLTLSNWLYIYADVTIQNLVSKNATVCLNVDNASAKLSGEVEIDSNNSLTFVVCKANRHLEVNSKITGDSTTTLQVRGQNLADTGLVYTFSGDASGFKGELYHNTTGGNAFNAPIDMLFTGSFGGRVKGLPEKATNVTFNHDGLPATRTTKGLVMSCATSADVQSVQTNITFYGSSDFGAANFPLMTFPAARAADVDPANFTVKYAETVDGVATPFTNLGKIVNGDNTITLVANAQIAEKPTAVTGLVYNGTEQTGVAAATGYTVANGSATDAGNYTATATLVSDYVWSDGTSAPVDREWSIAQKPLTDEMVSLNYYSLWYRGKLLKPTVTVTDGSKTLVENTDYTLTNDGGTDVGSNYEVIVVGKGNYSGTITKTFEIKQANISAVTLASASAEWTGQAITPTVLFVTAKNTDFYDATVGWSVTYKQGGTPVSEIIGIGEYTVEVTGINNLTGTAKTNFTVTKPKRYLLSAIKLDGPKVAVDTEWLESAFGQDKTFDHYQTEFLSTNQNGVSAWAAYILGFEGNKVSTAALIEKTTQSAMSGGKVTLTVALADMPTTRTVDGCEVKYSLLTSTDATALKTGEGDISIAKDVSGKSLEKCTESSFEVPAPTGNHAYYRIRAHFIFKDGGAK